MTRPKIVLTTFPVGKKTRIVSMSPSNVKTMLLFKILDLEYETVYHHGDLKKFPMKKLPVATIDGRMIADSERIRWHLKDTFGLDIDAHLSEGASQQQEAYKRLVEDSLYWSMLYFRWVKDTNWPVMREAVLGGVPKIIRGLVGKMLRKNVMRDAHGHGLSRHSESDIIRFTRSWLASLEGRLKESTGAYFGGEQPSSLDTSVFGWLNSAIHVQVCPELQELVADFPALLSYETHIYQTYFEAAEE